MGNSNQSYNAPCTLFFWCRIKTPDTGEKNAPPTAKNIKLPSNISSTAEAGNTHKCTLSSAKMK